jgi:hypothetical protein
VLHISLLQADTDVLVTVSQLKLTSGPKRSALEMLRRKIEAQTDRIRSARTDAQAAQKVHSLSASGVGCCPSQGVAIRCREQCDIADASSLESQLAPCHRLRTQQQSAWQQRSQQRSCCARS